MGCVPDHVPGAAVSVCGTCAWPEIAGAAVFDGATGGAAPTGLVGALVADCDPPQLEAVTVTRSVRPASAPAIVYEESVALEILEQFDPLVSQRLHR